MFFQLFVIVKISHCHCLPVKLDSFPWHSGCHFDVCLFFFPPLLALLPTCSCALLAELQGSVRQLERAAPGPQQGHPYGHQRGGGEVARHPADVSTGLQHPLSAADRQRPGHLPSHHQRVPGNLLCCLVLIIQSQYYRTIWFYLLNGEILSFKSVQLIIQM